MPPMLRNYFKIAFRNLLKHKIFSVINIAGLAVGLSASIIIGLYVAHELSFDSFHPQKERVYRVVEMNDSFTGGGMAKVYNAMGPALPEAIPDVESVVRLNYVGATTLKYGEKIFTEKNGYYSDAAFHQLFGFKWLEGEPGGALQEPNSIVLTSKLAAKYFGSEPALNAIMALQDGRSMKVTGVIEGLPENTHLDFDFLVSMNSYVGDRITSWEMNDAYTYLLLSPSAATEDVEKQIVNVVMDHRADDRQAYGEMTEAAKASFRPYQLQQLDDIYLHSHLFRELRQNGDNQQVKIGTVLAILILCIACINFMNLSTARSTLRAREVGIRKANGAHKNQLVFQFLTESVLMSLLAMVLSIGLVELSLPQANLWLQKQLSIDYPTTLPLLLVLALAVGLLSGAYPSFYLSSFRPTEVLKGKIRFSGKSRLRSVLIVFQFFLSVALIVASLTIYRQVQYMQTKNLGFDKESVVVMQTNSARLKQSHEQLMAAFTKLPEVKAASFTANLPGGSDWGIPVVAEGFTAGDTPGARVLCVDPSFVSTYGLEIVEGRNFSEEIGSDVQSGYIINEEAARQLGWEQPIGKQMGMPAVERPMGTVIGVVKDFHFRSLHEKIEPIVLFMQPEWSNIFSVKLAAGPPQATLEKLGEIWAEFDPATPFEPVFYDEQIDRLYRGEMKLQWLVRWFTGLGIFIACMGLFGLASLTATTRTKEFGIRKVLGANGVQIIGLLSKEFLQLILVAFLLATPVAWFLLSQWLENFAYRIDISPVTFLLTFVGIIVLAFATVSFHALKAAATNPVKSLRYE